jgi:hypothetical protein
MPLLHRRPQTICIPRNNFHNFILSFLFKLNTTSYKG